MAVEARHLNLFPSQLLTNREIMNPIEANINLYNNQMGYSSLLPFSASAAVTTTEAILPPAYNSLAADSFLHKTAVPSDSGLTYNNVVPMLSRKRSRDNSSNTSIDFPFPSTCDSFSFLGQDLSPHIQQQQLDIDQLIMQRMEKVRMEVEEKRKRQARRIIEAIEIGVIKKLKAKEEEIEKIGKLNWALEEKVKSLCIENQIWRDLAQTNEATANALRCNLEEVLAQRGEDNGGAGAMCPVVMDDAESCCGSTGGNDVGWRTLAGCAGVKDKDNGSGNGDMMMRMCRNCGKEESCVLILPCRHLCLCTVCGSTLHACPICKSFKTASVHVNMS
ncbi:hypothetical protein RJT34_29452 [Clitoria ternatea]|uniref:RING-type E3 ubiquitin transferase n=1 Tax=Clitoria ternatea TaxID=43366 RepID=A0AAN9FA52_CLITE